MSVLKKIQSKYIHEGWFKDDRELYHDIAMGYLYSRRENIKNNYHDIPLNLMVDQWQAVSGLDIKGGKIVAIPKVDATWNGMVAEIKKEMTDAISKVNFHSGAHVALNRAVIYADIIQRVRNKWPVYPDDILYFAKRFTDDNKVISLQEISMDGLNDEANRAIAIEKIAEQTVHNIFVKELRNKYLHWSASDGDILDGELVNNPNWGSNNELVRLRVHA